MTRKTTTPIESLEHSLNKRFADARISLDRPRDSSAVWFLDIELGKHSVAVQWQEGKGFGISSFPEYAYGEGVDEIYMDQEAAYGRIVSLLLSEAHTFPPPAVSLRELRKESGLSQTELAEVLHKQQGEISKIERRKDVLVSTLYDYARAIHAELQITVRLNDGKIRRVQLEEANKSTLRSGVASPAHVKEASR